MVDETPFGVGEVWLDGLDVNGLTFQTFCGFL